MVSAHAEEIDAVIAFRMPMTADEQNGEMRFFVGGRCIISGVFVSPADAPFVLAQWRQKARDTFVSDTMDAYKIISMLCDLKATHNSALVEQLRDLNERLNAIENGIRLAERKLDDQLYGLYKLSDAERMMVEADTKRRWDARLPLPPVA